MKQIASDTETETAAQAPDDTARKRHEFLNQLQDWRMRACVSVREAAAILSTPESQIRALCRRGSLNPITSLGRKWKIATEDIKAMLEKRLRNN